MSSNEKKQPWNPYPLASLGARKAFDLSPCAMTILMYLAARTDFRGKTWVGQRRVADDVGRSKGFVTEGFKELRERRLIEVTPGCRQAKQADRVVVSPALLRNPAWQELEAQNPNDQEDEIGNQNHTDQEDDFDQNPNGQDFQNPTHQDETLQLNHNLTGDLPPNLEKQLVSQPVDFDSSLRSSSIGTLVEDKSKPSVLPEQGKSKGNTNPPDIPDRKPRWEAEVDWLAWELLTSTKLPAFLGLPWFSTEDRAATRRIALVLRERGRNPHWLEGLIPWVKESKFWTKRMHSGSRGWSQLAKHLEKWELGEQFDQHLIIQAKGRQYDGYLFSATCEPSVDELLKAQDALADADRYAKAATDEL